MSEVEEGRTLHPPVTVNPAVVAAVAAQVHQRLAGARVQGVYQPLPGSLVLHLYRDHRRYRLVVDVEPRRLCVGLLPDAGPPNPPVPPAFCMLLRKHLEGTRLAAAAARDGDRVLYLAFHRGYGTPPLEGEAVLIVELTGRSANVLLQLGGRLAGWLRPPAGSRGLRLSAPYRPPEAPPPPAPGGTAPAAAADPARPTGAAKAWGSPETGTSAPGSDAPRGGAPRRDAPGEEPPAPSGAGEGLLDAFGRWWTKRVGRDQLEDRRRELLKDLRKAESRLIRRLEHQQADLANGLDAQRFREAGELLLAYADRVPRGSRRVTLPPPDQVGDDGAPVTIELVPELGPVENARLYFRRYRKGRRALQVQQAAAEATRHALFSVQLAGSLAREATSVSELERIEQELPAGARDALGRPTARREGRRPGGHPSPTGDPGGQGKGTAGGPEGIRRLRSSDGFEILVGRTATANDRLTLRLANPDDLWLHARALPGAHVVIRCGPADPPERTVLEAAVLAARNSAAGVSGAAVDVDVTRRRHVRKPPGSPPGFVVYDHERTVRVRPDRNPGPPAADKTVAP